MASYLSTQVSSKAVSMIGQAPTFQVETFSFALAGQTINQNDTITLCQLPIFSAVIAIFLSNTATGGATQTYALGTTTTPAQFLASSSTLLQSAQASFITSASNGYTAGSLPSARFTSQTVASIPAGLTLNPTSTVADYLVLKANVNAVAAGTGTLSGFVLYTLNTVS